MRILAITAGRGRHVLRELPARQRAGRRAHGPRPRRLAAARLHARPAPTRRTSATSTSSSAASASTCSSTSRCSATRPAILDCLWDSPAVIRAATGRGVSVDPQLLGELTVSMLRGRGRASRPRRSRKLAALARRRSRPSTSSCCPTRCSLGLAPPLDARARPAGRLHAAGRGPVPRRPGRAAPRGVAGAHPRARAARSTRFVATSDYYADFMAGYLGLPRERDRTRCRSASTSTGIEPAPRRARRAAFTVGYFARIAPEKGLHLLAEAYVACCAGAGPRGRRGSRPPGYLAPEHRGYLDGDRGRRSRPRAWRRVPLPRRRWTARQDRVPARPRRALGAQPVRGAQGPLPARGAGQRRARGRSRATARSRRSLEKTGGGLLFEPGDVGDLAAQLLRARARSRRGRASWAGAGARACGATTRRRAWRSARSRSTTSAIARRAPAAGLTGADRARRRRSRKELRRRRAGRCPSWTASRSSSRPGESLCVMGPSGSGKSTLLYILGALEPPTSGRSRSPAGPVRAVRDASSPPSATATSASCSRTTACCRSARCSRTSSCRRWSRRRDATHAARARELLEHGGPRRPARPPARPSSRAASGSAWPSRARSCCSRALLLCDEPTGNLDARLGATRWPTCSSTCTRGADDPGARHPQRRAGRALPRRRRAGGRPPRAPPDALRAAGLAAQPRPLLAHARGGGARAWPPRWRCWRARCWWATRCARACARSPCARLGRVRRTRSSATRFFGDDARRAASRRRRAPRPRRSSRCAASCTEASGPPRRARPVYGVDERFWAFQGVAAPGARGPRDALLSPALADELGAATGATLLAARSSRRRTIPAASLFGRRDDPGARCASRVAGVRRPRATGRVLAASRGSRRCARLSCRSRSLQRTLAQAGRVNTVLAAATGAAARRRRSCARRATLERPRAAPARGRARPARCRSRATTRLLATTRRRGRARGGRGAPGLAASRVAHLPRERAARGRPRGARTRWSRPWTTGALRALARRRAALAGAGAPPIVLNDWTARELGARSGDRVTLDVLPLARGGPPRDARRAEFRVAGDRAASPAPPPTATSCPSTPASPSRAHLADWDPPFPVDLGARPAAGRGATGSATATTPKAFVPLAAGQALWGHRLGAATSLRLTAREARAVGEARADVARRPRRCAARLDPAQRRPRRRARARAGARGRARRHRLRRVLRRTSASSWWWPRCCSPGSSSASASSSGCGELGPAARARLHRRRACAAVLLAEAAGARRGGRARWAWPGAVAYAWLMMLGLRTFWVGAVGTRALAPRAVAARARGRRAGGHRRGRFAIALDAARPARTRRPRACSRARSQDWRRARRAGGLGRRASRWRSRAALLGVGARARRASGRRLLRRAARSCWRARLARVAAPPRGRGRAAQPRPRRSPRARAAAARPSAPAAACWPSRSSPSAAFVIVVGRRVPPRAARRTTGTARPRAAASRSSPSRSSPLHHDPRTPEGREALGLDRGRRSTASPSPASACSRATTRAASTSTGPSGPTRARRRPRRSCARAASPSRLAGRDRRGAGQPVAAARARQPRRSDPGRRRRARARSTCCTSGWATSFALGDTGVARCASWRALAPGLFQGELVTGERHFQRAFPDERRLSASSCRAPAGREAAAADGARVAPRATSASTPSAPRRGSPRSTASRTPTSRRSRPWARSACCSAPSGWPPCSCATPSSGGASSRCCARSASGRRTSGAWCSPRTRCCCCLGLAIGAGAALVAILPGARSSAAALPSLAPVLLLVARGRPSSASSCRALAAAAVLRLPLLDSLRSE